MRVLHVIDTLDVGGAEKVLVALANGLAAKHEVSVCCISRRGQLARDLDPRVEVFCMGRGAGNDYLLPWRLAWRMRRARIDVVHTHNWGVFLEGGIAAWLARVPVAIHTVHGPYAAATGSGAGRLRQATRHWLERLVARRFRAIAAVSDSIRGYIPEVVGIAGARLCTVHNGIAAETRSVVSRAGRLVFIGVGRLDPIKNHEMMLRAFARVARRHDNARLVLLGDGPQRIRIEALLDELQLRDRVELPGFRDDIAERLADADVFLVSSRYEGISIALLEAMRAGLPVVATLVGGIAETVIPHRTGLLVPSENVEAFADAMSVLADSAALRRDYGSAARALQRDEFSLDAMLRRYGELYALPAGKVRASCR